MRDLGQRPIINIAKRARINASPVKFYVMSVAAAAVTVSAGAENNYKSDDEDPADVVVIESSAKAVTHNSTSIIDSAGPSPLFKSAVISLPR